MSDLPTGTVTFLFTDIEGSTRLLAEAGEVYGELLDEHRRIIGRAVEAHAGRTFGTEGDAVFAVFERATDALAAAAEFQQALAAHPWPDGRTIRVRAGIHSGEVTHNAGGYVGMTIHEVARIAAAAHGGQVLVSSASRELTADGQPAGVELRDLGVHRLKDVAHPARLYQLAADGLPNAFPPPRSLGRRPDNLPVQLSSFVGRGEIQEGRRLLAVNRLLTLTGPGGTGKTRLALQLSAEVADEFDDGVFFVPLDAIRDPELVPSAIVSALQLSVGAAPPMERAVEHLRDATALLVLDNFEQVVDAADVVSRLLTEAKRVTAIVTSRVPLRISGEQEFPVPPLDVPPASGVTSDDALRFEAVRLFVERARGARPDFRLDDANTPTVVEIVRRLDGLPLAIELAAVRVGTLPIEALNDRLDRRLAVLTSGRRDSPERQQTLRGAIGWSYDLLAPPDRQLFERFGVFAGAACLAEAEPICGPPDELGQEVLDGLASLAEKSLLMPVPGAVEAPRFGMLATIREYAADQLERREDAEALRRRHSETYLALIESSAPGLLGPRAKLLLDRLEQDHDNLRMALDWAVERGETAHALRFLVAVWRFWQIRGHLDEGWQQTARVLALPGVEAESAALRARAHGAAGGIAYWRGDGVPAHEHYRAALALARQASDKAILAEALYNFAFLPEPAEFAGGMAPAGRQYLEEATGLFRELDDVNGLAAASWALASSYAADDELESARALSAEALDLYRRADNRFGTGWSLFILAQVNYRLGNIREAVGSTMEAMEVFVDTGDVTGIAMGFLGLAFDARALGDTESYWQFGGAADALRRRAGLQLITGDALDRIGMQSIERPTDPEALRAWEAGDAMSREDAVAYAFAFGARVLHPEG